MSQARVRQLLDLAVSPSTLRAKGPLTVPPSWGVYRIAPGRRTATSLFRCGNHPIREIELRKEFGCVRALALFTDRALAVELRALLNAGHAV